MSASRLEAGSTRLPLGHSLRVVRGPTGPPVGGGGGGSSLSARLRAFLPELAHANEQLAERVAREGAAAVDIEVLEPAPAAAAAGAAAADEGCGEGGDDEGSDEEGGEGDGEGGEADLPRHIAMEFAVTELLPGLRGEDDDDDFDSAIVGGAETGDGSRGGSAALRKRPRVLIEEVRGTADAAATARVESGAGGVGADEGDSDNVSEEGAEEGGEGGVDAAELQRYRLAILQALSGGGEGGGGGGAAAPPASMTSQAGREY